jgi:hypothetical protein
MTDDDRLPTCSQHRWSELRPVWSEDGMRQDPTQMRRFCLYCNAETTFRVVVGGHK